MQTLKLKIIALMLGFIYMGAVPCHGITLVSQTLEVNGYSVQLQVPSGLRVEFLANLSQPRFLAPGPGGEFIIGSSGNQIYRLKKPYRTSEVLVSLAGKNHSVAYRDGQLFVAETAGLYAAAYADADTSLDSGDFALYVQLPSVPPGHWSRTVIVGPDHKLYISLGISGNCTNQYLDNSYPFEDRRGGVFVVDETGNSPELVPYSSGLRNPIGIAFHPQTDVLYATNAGSDDLGFDLPPEVFAALSDGSFHGMPWFQYYDGAFQRQGCIASQPPRPAGEATPPEATFAARSTPQGIAFVTDSTLGAEFNGNALVAIHGSWATPDGGGPETRRAPKIVMVEFSEGRPTGVVEDIVTGFQRSDGSRFARPSGMLMGPDGRLYFTSDSTQVTGLFRLTPIPKAMNSGSLYELLLN